MKTKYPRLVVPPLPAGEVPLGGGTSTWLLYTRGRKRLKRVIKIPLQLLVLIHKAGGGEGRGLDKKRTYYLGDIVNFVRTYLKDNPLVYFGVFLISGLNVAEKLFVINKIE